MALFEGVKGGNSNLNDYYYPPVFNLHLVRFDVFSSAGEALAGAKVEAPTVQVAFDNVSAETAVGERRPPVRAEILGGEKLAADIVEREFSAAFEVDGRAASGRHVIGSADCHRMPFAARLSGIAKVVDG